MQFISTTRREAVLHSVGANAAHGLRRTNEDKRRAVLTLLNDEEWGKWSDREIARRCGVTNKTVAAYRNELSEEIPQIGNSRTVERNGTVYEQDTANIGKDSSKKKGTTKPQATDTEPAGPTPPPEDEGYNLTAEFEAALAENRHLRELIESLKKDDLARELAEAHERYARREGRLRAAITSGNEAQKQAIPDSSISPARGLGGRRCIARSVLVPSDEVLRVSSACVWRSG
ncbi:MAG TPA: hypothetical protein VFL97_02220 [Nitrococcus sp.]|nr:hypothetical protein [Nitrococcus sp.]